MKKDLAKIDKNFFLIVFKLKRVEKNELNLQVLKNQVGNIVDSLT